LSLFALFAIQLENTRYCDTTDHRNQSEPESVSAGPEYRTDIDAAPQETVTFLSSLPVPAMVPSAAVAHRKPEPDTGGLEADYTSQQVQVVQTDSGEILLVACDPFLQEPDRYRLPVAVG
jgi:hypothetical protein